MATNNSLQYALSRIEILNSVIRQLRSTGQSAARQLSELDSSIVNPEKLAVLKDGLAGLSVDDKDIKTKVAGLQTVCQHILDNVEELTK